MQPVWTTGLLCAVGKLSHGRIPASLTVERSDECAFIEKRPDAERLKHSPFVVVSLAGLNSSNNEGGNPGSRSR